MKLFYFVLCILAMPLTALSQECHVRPPFNPSTHDLSTAVPSKKDLLKIVRTFPVINADTTLYSSMNEGVPQLLFPRQVSDPRKLKTTRQLLIAK
jgi:hypothetical protein